MAYASTQEIEIAAGGADRLVQLLDWDNNGIVDPAVIAQLQVEVDSWIDSYAGRRFSVPIQSPSAVLRLHAAEEAVYRARLKRGTVSEEATQAHQDRLQWLEGLAKGLVVPSDPEPSPATTVRSAWVSRDENSISREKMRGAW